MNKLIAFFSFIAVVSAFSQGQVQIVSSTEPGPRIHYSGGPLDGMYPSEIVTISYGNLNLGGIYAHGALYGAPGSITDPSTLQMLGPSVPFRTGTRAGYLDPSANGGNSVRTIPGAPAGSTATFQFRAWDTGLFADGSQTYEAAKAIIDGQGAGYYGMGNLFSVTVGGPPTTPPILVGAADFAITWVPEPSILALAVPSLLAGLYIFRRRR